MLKNSPANAGDGRDVGSLPGSQRFAGAGGGNPLQSTDQENPMDKGAWWDTDSGITELDTTEQLSM